LVKAADPRAVVVPVPPTLAGKIPMLHAPPLALPVASPVTVNKMLWLPVSTPTPPWVIVPDALKPFAQMIVLLALIGTFVHVEAVAT
jgi:hypothetical protein